VRSKGLGILFGVMVALVAVGPLGAQDAPAARQATPAPAEGLLTGPAPVASHWSKNKYPEAVPEGAPYYLVVRGDTLWDLAQRFLGSAYLWPQIWDQNKYITDAHWIYPGDPILLPKLAVLADKAGQAGALTDEERAEAERQGLAPEDQAGATAPGSVLYPVSEEETIRCAPYIVHESEDESFRIIGSEEGSDKVAFSTRDVVYLNKGSNSGVKAGDEYTIHKRGPAVKHPKSGKMVGSRVDTNGIARVILVQDDSATAVIEFACFDILADNYLKPKEGVNVPLLLRRPPADRLTPPSGKATGYVLDIQETMLAAAAGHLITIDLGSEDGIAPGSVLTVYRIVYPKVPTSRNVIGEIAVLTVRDNNATAKVTYSTAAVVPGDRVELR
jgi:hypothetical protein